jgi:hypothetical protein
MEVLPQSLPSGTAKRAQRTKNLTSGAYAQTYTRENARQPSPADAALLMICQERLAEQEYLADLLH